MKVKKNRIFISYRREEAKWFVGHLYETLTLCDAFGPSGVFRDTEDIQFGDDFRKRIEKALTNTDIVLAIIGPRWTELLKAKANESHDDLVTELEIAHQQGARIIPILIDNEKMPKEEDLPGPLKAMNFQCFQAFLLREADYVSKTQKLIEFIKEIREQKRKASDGTARRKAEVKGRRSDQERPIELSLAHDKLNSSNSLDRKAAAKMFGKFVGEESVEGLLTLLHDPDDVVANKAKEILLRPDYIKDLADADIDFIKKASEQRDKGTISELEFLRLLPLSDTEETLKYALDGIRLEDSEARATAVSILGQLGNPVAVNFLPELLKDPNEAVAKAAITALIRLADIDESNYEALYDALTDPSPQLIDLLCNKLVNAYGHITPVIEQARKAGSVDRFVDNLLARLDHNDEEVRCGAIFVLQRIREERAVEPLVSLLEETSLSTKLHTEVINALGEIGDDRAVQPLLKIINNILERFELKKYNLRHSRPEDGFGWEYGSQQWYLENAVVRALGRIGDPQAVNTLLNYMKYTSQYDTTIRALGHIGDLRAIVAIAKVVDNTDIRFLRSMVDALVEIGGPRAVDALLKHLQADWSSGEPGNLRVVYTTLAEGLGRMGDPRAVEALAPLLKNDQPEIRATTIEALAQIGGQHAIDTLVAQLEIAESKDKTAIEKALEALRR